MVDEPKKTETREDADRREAQRREFLKKAGKIAATTPVVTLLLSARSKSSASDVVISRIW